MKEPKGLDRFMSECREVRFLLAENRIITLRKFLTCNSQWLATELTYSFISLGRRGLG